MFIPAFFRNLFKGVSRTRYTILHDEEKEDPMAEPTIRPPVWQTLQQPRQMGFALRIVVEMALLLALFVSVQQIGRNFDALSRVPWPVNDNVLPDYLKQPPNIPVVWRHHEEFVGNSKAADKAWDKMMPSGTGYIYLEDWKDFGLKEGKEALDGKRKPRKGKTYAVTAFHELHCLAIIRETLKFAAHPNFDWDKVSNDGLSIRIHVGHCMEYLRQAMMCNADPTVENLEVTVNETGAVIVTDHGWGNTHICRNWDALYEWTAARGPAKSFGIRADHYFKHLDLS